MRLINFLEKNSKVSWVFTLVIAALIFFFSTFQSDPVPRIYAFGLKSIIYHFSIFLLLGFFLTISFVKGKKFKLAFLSILLGALYAATDEIHQYFVPGRNCSINDFLVDLSGVFVGVVIYLIIKRFQKNN